MARTALAKVDLMLEKSKLKRLRHEVKARSNSEAVRVAIDRQLAAPEALAALRGLRDRGTLDDAFGRLRPNH